MIWLAQALRGRYVYLPNARAEEIASVLAAAPASAVAGTRYPAALIPSLDSER